MGPAGPSKKKAAETFRSVRPLLMDLVRPRRGKLALGFLLMLINISMSVVLPGAPRYVLDNVIGKKEYWLLTPLVAGGVRSHHHSGGDVVFAHPIAF